MKKQLQYLFLLVVLGISLEGCSIYPSLSTSGQHVSANALNNSVNTQPAQPLKPSESLKPELAPKKIALLLPLSGPLSSAGQALLRGFLASYYQKNTHMAVSPKPVLNILDTGTLGAKGALDKAVLDHADLIIGPLGRQAVQQVIDLPHNQIPWLLLNYAKSDIDDNTVYQFSLSSEDEATYVAQQAWSAGYRHPLLIVNKSDLGRRISTQFDQVWSDHGGTIADQLNVDRNENENKAVADALLVSESRARATALRKLLSRQIDFTVRRRQDIDMIFLQASAEQSRQIRPALKFYFAGSLPVVALSGIYNGEPKAYQNKDLNGVYFTASPWQLKTLPLMATIHQAWPETTQPDLSNLYAMGVDADSIYPYLVSLSQLPGVSLQCYTGSLFMDKHRNIHRQLQWATFKKGKVALQNLPSNNVVFPQNKSLKNESFSGTG